MSRLISFDISADFGLFKKPDINKYSLSYNLPPRPTIYGILGAILGLEGLKDQYHKYNDIKDFFEIGDYLSKDYSKGRRYLKKQDLDKLKKKLEMFGFEEIENLFSGMQEIIDATEKNYQGNVKIVVDHIKDVERMLLFPRYYEESKHLKIGIKPDPNTESISFPFNKIMNKYNSGDSYFGGSKYPNIIISEQILIKPSYRIYVYDETDSSVMRKLLSRLKTNSPVFMPYLGKNEFIANISNVQEFKDYKEFTSSKSIIDSIFIVSGNQKGYGEGNFGEDIPSEYSVTGLPSGYLFYENYPVDYNDELQYEMEVVKYTSDEVDISEINLKKGQLIDLNKKIIYLF